MNWENTIIKIRKDPDFIELVRDAYFNADLIANVERFRKSTEFIETHRMLKEYKSDAPKLLDIGSGNGIAAVSFALEGYEVLAIEPDPSDTVGAGAIRKLQQHYQLENLEVKEMIAEDLSSENYQFEIIYVRQALHHAYDLNLFVKSATGLLKQGGVFMAVREHVIYDKKDKEWFLSSHPLQKFYGGENAFTLLEYELAFKGAGLSLLKKFGHYENVINYSPLNAADILQLKTKEIQDYKMFFSTKYKLAGKMGFAWTLYKWVKRIKEIDFPKERKIPGRLYSFIYKKQ